MPSHYLLFAKLDRWIEKGWLNPLDKAFVRFLAEQEADASDLVLWLGALVSYQMSQGEVYLDLEKLSQHPAATLALLDNNFPTDGSEPLPDEIAELGSHQVDHWKKSLRLSTLVGSDAGNTPLVLDGNRLYLRRFWGYQQIVNAAIKHRLTPIRNSLPSALQTDIANLFSENGSYRPDWQKIACVLALRARFTIITGGPGTGKTTTLTKLLVLILSLSAKESTSPRKFQILLAAPTGKAAARVSEAIVNVLKNLTVDDEIKALIPTNAFTLHRLLGSRPNSRQYQYHRRNRLLADIVIVDEASMIDLEMMAALLDALPDSAHLILLGDKDQLASVEPGSVLGDLCHGSEQAAYHEATRAWIAKYAGEALAEIDVVGSDINQQTVMLRTSHRFDASSGIGQLAQAVNMGNCVAVDNLLNAPETYRDIKRLRLPNAADNQFKRLVLGNKRIGQMSQWLPFDGYGYYLDVIHQHRPRDHAQNEQWAKNVLAAFDTFRVLAAQRQGPWGVEYMNQQIQAWLFPEEKHSPWFEGRPVMITRNDYNLGLMNGDIGITLRGNLGKLLVAFPYSDAKTDKKILWISPLRLPDVETAFVMTVHKSQGSEFDHTALLLPDTPHSLLNRELIYTAITRAKNNFTLIESHRDVFDNAILTSRRASQ